MLALGAGCGPRNEPRGDLEQPYPVSRQGVGENQTVLREAPERIVALDAGSAELVATIGAGARLVGVPAGVRLEGAEEAHEVVRPNGRILVEAVVALEPDLILASPGNDPLDTARAERESGAALYVQPAASVADVERAAIDLGFLVGRAPEARQLVGAIRQRVAEIERRLEAAETVTTFVDTGFFITVPDRSLLGDLVRRAKGESVAGANPGPDPFPLRRLVALDPQVYLTVTGSRVRLPDLRRHPVAGRITAVQEGRFAVLPAVFVTRPGPRVADGLEAVARALHPDAFAE